MIVWVMRTTAIALLAAITFGCASEPVAEPSGAALFARHCASCHGVFGEGDGPVAAVMQVDVPNLQTLRTRSGGSFPADAVMRYIDGRGLPAAHGARLMPVWGDIVTPAGIAEITEFVRQLQD